jgi:hypothetical protein
LQLKPVLSKTILNLFNLLQLIINARRSTDLIAFSIFQKFV